MIKIYYVPSSSPGRSYKAMLQGLRNNSRIELVDEYGSADLIFYSDQADSNVKYDPDKVVFIDFSDDPQQTHPINCFAYFKRSWVLTDSKFNRHQPKRPKHHYPIAYAIMDEFLLDEEYERSIDFGCYLRPQDDPKKKKIIQLAKKIEARNTYVGEINRASRNVFDKQYLSTLKKTRITLSSNPVAWEGDSRTWEALANSTLLFVDKMYVPIPNMLEDEKHIIYWDFDRLDDMMDKISYYLNNNEECKKIAKNGFEHAMKYHRTVNRIDYILQTIGA